jgi:hypothetical protein
MTITTLVPVPGDAVAQSPTAPRPHGLDRATIGIMCNVKRNGPELMSAIADLLCAEFDIAEVVGPVRAAGTMLPSEEQLADMAARCDVVITGLGDCGSCSACSIHVAADFERRGVPTAAICTKPFLRSGQAMAARQGLPGYRFVMVDHPLSSLTAAEVRDRAKDALPQVLAILGVDDYRAARQREHALTAPQTEQAS